MRFGLRLEVSGMEYKYYASPRSAECVVIFFAPEAPIDVITKRRVLGVC